MILRLTTLEGGGSSCCKPQILYAQSQCTIQQFQLVRLVFHCLEHLLRLVERDTGHQAPYARCHAKSDRA
jgi:hypothetical protein